jgi:hypothetical protein
MSARLQLNNNPKAKLSGGARWQFSGIRLAEDA